VLASTAAPAHVSAYQKTALHLGPITASAGAATTVTASLLTENITVLPDGQIISVGGFDRPLPGQVVTFDFGGAAPPQSAVTDASGLATVSVVFPSPATVTATASFLNAADFYTNSTGAVPSAVETAAAPVTVADATPPTIEAHPGISVPATSGAGATVTYTSPASHDAVSGDGTAVCLPASGSTFVPGPTTVNCTATDAAGNHSSSSFVVTVTNNVPTFTPPANITAPSTFAAGAVVTFVATGSDVEDGPIPAACIPESGAVFPRGVTTVGCTVTDASGAAATASFTVTVLNAMPVAVNDAYTGQWNTPLTVAPNGVLANDTDANNDPLTSILGAGPSHGVLALNANGEFTYTPAAGYYGTDSFTYRADDGLGGMTALATVRLTITTPCPARHGHDRDDHRWWDRDDDRDDGKCGRGTAIAQDDVFSAHENTPLSVAAGNGVLDNDGRYAATALGVTTPAHGTVTLNANGSLVYMPAAGFFGIDSFLYAARNNAGITGPAARVRIIVRRNIAPDADNDYYSTKKKETLTVKPNGGVLDNDSDPNRDPIAAVLVSGPSHGTLMLNANGSFVYKPAATFTGTDAFTYKAADPAGLTDTATVTIRVGVSRGRDDDDRPSKHYRGDRSDHELGRGGHFDGDDCEYDRMFRR
jgi:VCBS repeat-containing protein